MATYAQVICLQLRAHHVRAPRLRGNSWTPPNPGFAERAQRPISGIAVAPDADAVVGDTTSFRIVELWYSGGMLKPNIVYFGENVPKDRVDEAYSLVDEADALLVAGSSLTVYSGYRFVRHAAALGIPIAIINRGRTARRRAGGGEGRQQLSPMLVLLAGELASDTASCVPLG